mgnify:FL=1
MDFRPARQPTSELLLSFDAPAGERVAMPPVAVPAMWSGPRIAPWRRFLARQVDLVVNGIVGINFVAWGLYGFVPLSAERFFGLFEMPYGRVLDALFGAFVAMPVNAVFIGLSGSTIGKAVFGVKVVDGAGNPIGIARAFRRELHVWIVGICLQLPILAYLTMIAAYRRLKDAGTTPWDAAQGLTVLHRPVGAAQRVLDVLGVAMLLGWFAYVIYGD